MDKYDIVFDIIEHPGRYSSECLAEILADKETREIYNLLCKTQTSVDAHREVDVEAEWKSFCVARPRRGFHFLWLSGRAASVAAFLVVALFAVAVGFAVKVAVVDNNPNIDQTVSKDAHQTEPAVIQADTAVVTADTTVVAQAPVLFENASLAEIMKSVDAVYGVQSQIRNPKVAELHLYYLLDPTLSLEETIEQLNTFEQINIRVNGNVLTID